MPDRGAPQTSAALSEAVGAVVEESARRLRDVDAREPAPRPLDAGWLAAALGSWGLVAGLLLLQPPVASGPPHQPWVPAPALAEASVRYGLWLAHHRIEAFRAGQNRLPVSLAEAGVVDTSLRMSSLTRDDYAVAGQQGKVVLLLTSGMAPDSFLGRSLARLRQP